MDYDKNEFRLLSVDEVISSHKLEILNDEKMGAECTASDFAILLGINPGDSHVAYCNTLKGRICPYVLSSDSYLRGFVDNFFAYRGVMPATSRRGGIRPVLPYKDIDVFSQDAIQNNINSQSYNAVINNRGVVEIEYGEYPQYAVTRTLGKTLDKELLAGKLIKTGKQYHIDKIYLDLINQAFHPQYLDEYIYNGKKYVRVIPQYGGLNKQLSNKCKVEPIGHTWVEVSPIKWLVDEKAKLLVSKIVLAAGVRFCDDEKYDGNFKNSEMYMFLNKYMVKDIVPSNVSSLTVTENKQVEVKKKKLEKKINPYNFNFDNVSEEDIIKGSIESGVAVFLHGASSEGKSARVKQIDPTCEIIYLRNASPESLNGKSVYNGETGEMIDIKPTWLKKVEAKCESELDRLHIVFFDEITNALPSIQNIAYNIVLDREVNGIWKLPENARIVASGNEMEDSLAANKLAEPLFNRFAHVYIKTTTESWLKWASEHNIHPAIYTYIAYKKGKTLRSKFDGEKPNADPRKWEMASKVLYATGNPQMLRSLVGEDITKEFVSFCKNKVITLDDVIEGNYEESEIKELNTAERYATAMTLSQVDEDNLEKVRTFVAKLGGECRAIFDSLWTHGDDERLEKIAELEQDVVCVAPVEDMNSTHINQDDARLTLLTKDELDTLSMLKKYGKTIEDTDLALSTGSYWDNNKAGYYYTKTIVYSGITIVDSLGNFDFDVIYTSDCSIRPVLVLSPNMFLQICKKAYCGDITGVKEVEFGEYPQFTVSTVTQTEIENAYQDCQLVATGGSYTINEYNWSYPEYEYNGDKYIRVKGNFSLNLSFHKDYAILSNNERYSDNDHIWIKVTPIKWLIDEENQKLISKFGLLSGIRFDNNSDRVIDGNFEITEMYEFLNKYMVKDMLQSYKREKGKIKKLSK